MPWPLTTDCRLLLNRIPNYRGSQETDSTTEYTDLQYIRNTYAGKVGIRAMSGGNKEVAIFLFFDTLFKPVRVALPRTEP